MSLLRTDTRTRRGNNTVPPGGGGVSRKRKKTRDNLDVGIENFSSSRENIGLTSGSSAVL